MISPSDGPDLVLAGFAVGGAEGVGATGSVGRGNVGAACRGRLGGASRGTLGTVGANCSDSEGAGVSMAGGFGSVGGFTTCGADAVGVVGAGGSAEGSSSCAIFDRKPLAGRSSSGMLSALRFPR